MEKKSILDSVLYKNRHLISFFAIAFLLYFFIVFSFARFPVGLSQAEMNSAVLSSNFSFPESIINLPYHFLQWLSINAFGLSTFSLRLPSVVLALFSAGLIIGAIRNFSKNNVAIITGLIMSCSVFFLNFARNGSPEIMSIFLISLAIFAMSQIIKKQPYQLLWLSLLAVAVALGVYAPGGIVFFVVLVTIALVNSKSREMILSLKIWQIILAIVVGLIVLAPIVVLAVTNSNLILTALGLNNISFSGSAILTNLQVLFSPFGAEFGGYVTPLLSIGELALVALGVIKLIRDGKSTRGVFVLTISAVSLLISIFLRPMTFLMFVPWVFLIAFGVMFIIDYWYKLFPLNPYARTLGIIPIGILVVIMMSFGRIAYVNANYYDSKVINARNTTFETLKEEINALSAHNIKLVVPEGDAEFYNLLEKVYPSLDVTTKYSKDYETQILLSGTYDQTTKSPTKIVTGSGKTNSDLMRIYQK